MTNDIENGMLVGADAEWERLNEPTPYDQADEHEIEEYAFDRDMVHEVVAVICGLDVGDLTEEVAVMILDHLDKTEVWNGLRKWFDGEDERKYNEWFNDRNNWD